MAAEPPEREVQHEPPVLAGDDEVPRQPEDWPEYRAEGPADAARWTRLALRIALAVLVAVAAVVLWAILS